MKGSPLSRWVNGETQAVADFVVLGIITLVRDGIHAVAEMQTVAG